MANIPLSRSEVFGELRKELHEDKEFHHSDVHVFIIMGASVRSEGRSLVYYRTGKMWSNFSTYNTEMREFHGFTEATWYLCILIFDIVKCA